MKSILTTKRVFQLFIALAITTFLFAVLIAPSAVFAEQSTSTHVSQKDSKKPKTVTETQKITFKTHKQNDPNTAKGKTVVLQKGVNGTKKVTYKVTYPKGKKAKKTFVSQKVVTAAIDKIVGVGTYIAPTAPAPMPTPAPASTNQSCDSNYSGVCVPIASDVDCAGGSGNGPAYVQGPVTVIGSDIYGLDRDGNGTGCE